MTTDDARHVPVLADEALHWLKIRPEGCYLDCTAGLGGHSARIAAALTTGRLVALDRDPAAVAIAAERLVPFPHATVRHANYEDLGRELDAEGLARVDGVLLDAGVSSMQLDESVRGFSFQADGPLDMRMDTSHGPTAREFLADTPEQEIAALLRRYGDVGPAKRIAASIVRRRNANQMSRTTDLVAAVQEALDFVQGTPDEIRTVFQAVRMAVNDELRALERALESAMDRLNPGGRLVVIAFHSGEDRVVKNVLRDGARKQRLLHPDGRVRETIPPRVRVLTPSPVLPGEEEMCRNPRAKSAKLRAAERREN